MKEIGYNEEIYSQLAEYEDVFYTAVNCDFVRMGGYERKKTISDLYSRVFNKKSGIMDGCGRCLLNDTKRLGEVYYRWKSLRGTRTQEEETTDTKEVKKTVPSATATDKTVNRKGNGRTAAAGKGVKAKNRKAQPQ